MARHQALAVMAAALASPAVVAAPVGGGRGARAAREDKGLVGRAIRHAPVRPLLLLPLLPPLALPLLPLAVELVEQGKEGDEVQAAAAVEGVGVAAGQVRALVGARARLGGEAVGGDDRELWCEGWVWMCC